MQDLDFVQLRLSLPVANYCLDEDHLDQGATQYLRF